MNNQITYADKVALNQNSSIPDINKVNATDMNEIKAKHNGVMNGSIPMGNVVVDSIRSKNMLSRDNIRYGIYNVGQGAYVYGTNACCTANRIEIDNTKDYVLSTSNTQTTSSFYVMFYNANGTYLGNISATFSAGSLRLGTYSNYSNAKYVNFRFDIEPNNLINPMFEEGTTKTTYTPYQNLGNSKPVNYASQLTPLANISFNTNKQIFEKNSDGLVIVNLTFVANESIDMVGNADLFSIPPNLNPSGNIVLTIASTTQNLVNTAYIRTANATIRGKLNATINQGSEISLIGSYYI